MRLSRVCVYAGSSAGERPAYAGAARSLAGALVARGLDVVYGGGHVGLMGVLADAVVEAGGEIIGVIPEALYRRELGHRSLADLRVVGSMHERKALMADLSEAFVALPGGIGTMEELIEVLTWTQLGLHGKPCGLLNVDGYWDPLIAMFDRAVADGFLTPEGRALLLVAVEPDELIERLEQFVPPPVQRRRER
jgi:uncharacterized protein (TIGR00730 family)